MKHKLKDGRVVDIVLLNPKIPVKSLLEYINSFISENSFLTHDKPLTLKQEKEWLGGTLKGIKRKEQLYYCALSEGKVVAGCTARQGLGRERQNIILGIAVRKEFRRTGLGEFLMRHTIAQSKKKLNPKNIYLSVAAPNKPAKALYGKLGFVEMGRFPKWIKHKGKFHDVFWMLLKK
jgi:ribosomal protein S18 acetylase RimI-like enzyme